MEGEVLEVVKGVEGIYLFTYDIHSCHVRHVPFKGLLRESSVKVGLTKGVREDISSSVQLSTFTTVIKVAVVSDILSGVIRLKSTKVLNF